MNFARPQKESAGKALRALLNLPHEAKVAQGILHTPQEIAQQPATWVSTHRLFESRRDEIDEFLSAAGIWDDIARRPTVLLIGAGTSDYIGQSLVHLLRQRWQCEAAAVPSTDLLTHVDSYVIPGRRYLWISFSRSGDSPEGVALLARTAERYPDIRQLVVSCNKNGRMLRSTDGQKNRLGVCLEDAVNDRGLAMTSSFSNMAVFGQCLGHIRTGDEYQGVLRQLVEAGESFLGVASDCAAELAAGSHRKACFVGSGALKAAARESALKVLELTAGNIQTMSESGLGLRHGPMAALNRETLFVCFVSGDERVQRYEKDLLDEIGRKHVVRSRIAIGLPCEEKSNRLADRCLSWAPELAVPDHYRPPLDVIFGQLLGLFFSLSCKLQPDCPSPSAVISRVVQNVNIYS
jgi:tagatose-6-phosphate ketose/aldose isomerase